MNALKTNWRLSTILKTSIESVWSNAFSYVPVCIFSKCESVYTIPWIHNTVYIQYTIHWDKTQILKNLSSDKINGTKNIIFFLLRAPAHHSFTFNLRFSHELKHKVRLSKTVCVGFSIFKFIWFLLKFIFLLSKMHRIFDLIL